MSRLVGMGANKKGAKEVETKLKQENRELVAANKMLHDENAVLREKIAGLEAGSAGKCNA